MKTSPLIAEYPEKHLSEFTPADTAASNRYNQGKKHAKQGRTDLVGQCPHYDAGYSAGLQMEGAA